MNAHGLWLFAGMPLIIAISLGATTTAFAESSLSDLVQAKVDLNGPQPRVIVVIQTYRTESRTASVTKLMREVRVRKVPDGKGGIAEKEETVIVPVEEEIKQEVFIPAGAKPVVIDAAELKFFDLDAHELSVQDAGKKLRQLSPVFLIDPGSSVAAMSPSRKRALKENVLMIQCSRNLRGDYDKENRFKAAISFHDLVLAKQRTTDEQNLSFEIENFQITEGTEVHEESRIRLDTADGKTLLLKYPRLRSKKVWTGPVKIVADGMREVSLAATKLEFFSINGDRVSKSNAMKSLKSPQPLFLLDARKADTVNLEIPSLYAAALKDDCLIGVTSTEVHALPHELRKRLITPPSSEGEPAKDAVQQRTERTDET